MAVREPRVSRLNHAIGAIGAGHGGVVGARRPAIRQDSPVQGIGMDFRCWYAPLADSTRALRLNHACRKTASANEEWEETGSRLEAHNLLVRQFTKSLFPWYGTVD